MKSIKQFTIFLMLTLSVSAIAEVSRGYLAENRRGELSYYGLTDRNIDVGFMLKYESSLSDEQISKMFECMENRDEYAIQVIRNTERISVPTGLPGQNTIITSTKNIEIDCVRAPGFIKVWRDFFN